MKLRIVRYSDDASSDLEEIAVRIALNAGPKTAQAYVSRIVDFCDRMDLASLRGYGRDDMRSGLRIVGFERRVTIAFAVDDEEVRIVRIFYGGRDWESDLSDD